MRNLHFPVLQLHGILYIIERRGIHLIFAKNKRIFFKLSLPLLARCYAGPGGGTLHYDARSLGWMAAEPGGGTPHYDARSLGWMAAEPGGGTPHYDAGSSGWGPMGPPLTHSLTHSSGWTFRGDHFWRRMYAGPGCGTLSACAWGRG